MPETSSNDASAFCLDLTRAGIEDSVAERVESPEVFNSPTN